MQQFIILTKSDSDCREIKAGFFCTGLKERGSDEKKRLYHNTGIIINLFLRYHALIIDGKAEQFEIDYILKCLQ